ncbi:MAG: hypothetical protein PHG60_00030 [Candidatus Dojkabacteria bacterium]|jgi:hypothetical protein|nr:hypothetical protein [Candidatus Dojkabacteria bacterium]
MESKNLIINNSGQQLLNETKVNSYFEILIDFLKDFFSWWYIQMPIWHLRTLRRVVVILDDNLSFTLLLRHFFLPWHRDRNILGYLVGIVSKLFYLPIAFGIICAAIFTYILFIFFWLLLPPSTFLFIIRSFWI